MLHAGKNVFIAVDVISEIINLYILTYTWTLLLVKTRRYFIYFNNDSLLLKSRIMIPYDFNKMSVNITRLEILII